MKGRCRGVPEHWEKPVRQTSGAGRARGLVDKVRLNWRSVRSRSTTGRTPGSPGAVEKSPEKELPVFVKLGIDPNASRNASTARGFRDVK